MTTNILLTGATGYIGNLIACVLLTKTNAHLYLLVRPHHQLNDIIDYIGQELAAQKTNYDANAFAERITLLYLPENNEFINLAQHLIKQNLPINEIIHAAGHVEYFDQDLLEKVNIKYTHELLEYAKHIHCKRFIYTSTAYSAGYTDSIIEEKLLPEPLKDPTLYTHSKRQAERLIALSGVPFLILRPSNVIGDSRNGHYLGKRYGLYQQWLAYERLFSKTYAPVLHFLANDSPLNLIHQDAFVDSFWGAYQYLPDNSWLNMVTHEEKQVNTHELVKLWVKEVSRPQKVIYYNHIEDIPFDSLTLPERTFINFIKVNADISTHEWKFSTENLDKLIAKGMPYANSTINTVAVCQNEFVKHSPRIQEYMKRHHANSPKPEDIEEIFV